MIKITSLLAAAVVALGMTGCVKIESETATQSDTIGEELRVTTTICVADGGPSSNCPGSDSNWNTSSAGDAAGQLLVAYRLPTGATAPDEITAEYRSPQTGAIELAASSSYTSQLEAKAAPPAGQKWAGYVSPEIPAASQVDQARIDVEAAFKLPAGSAGAPFHLRTVLGVRNTENGSSAGSPVVCGEDVTDSGSGTVCVDSPKGDEATALSGERAFPTRALSVLSADTVNVAQGSVATVPFTVRAPGFDGSISAALSAETSAYGALAAPQAARIRPQDGDNNAHVTVYVPPQTPPGTYDVTLIATVDGQERSNRGRITVTPPAQDRPPAVTEDTTPPLVSVAGPGRQKLGAALKKGLKLRVTCSEACRGALTLGSKRAPLAKGSVSRTSPGSFTVVAKFTRAARKKYASARSLKTKAHVDVSDAAGLSRSATRSISLKR